MSLTVGLLNKLYLKDEQEKKSKEIAYLQSREKFLDKQLVDYNKDQSLRSIQDEASALSMQILENLKVTISYFVI